MKVGSYILAEEIGSGSFGTVYKGYHKKSPEEVLAIKVIFNTGSLDTLLVEPELLSQLDHPNIISLKDYFIDTEKLVLVTEYIDGSDLQCYLKQQKQLSVEEVRNFLIQMADALAYAHKRNIIHRDIKPSNILITVQDGKTRFILADFGVGRIAQGIQTVKHIAGTYHYMAPEQLRGRPCEQSDLWALGVCAYNLLTGSKPFEGNTVDELYKDILLRNANPISESLLKTDPELEKVIFNLLEKNLSSRINSAGLLARDLKRLDVSRLRKVDSKIPFKKKTAQTRMATWEENDAAELKKSWIFVFISLLFWSLIFEISELFIIFLSSLGVFTFYLGQLKNSRLKTAAGVRILIYTYIFKTVFPFLLMFVLFKYSAENEVSNVDDLSAYFQAFSESNNFISLSWRPIPGFIYILFKDLSIGSIFLVNTAVVIIAVAASWSTGYFFSKTQQLKEKLIVHNLLRESSSDRKKLISTLKRFVDTNWKNINVRQKYIELLLLDGKTKEAIVEAELAIEVDPYNFGINLLLANAYMELGLNDECIKMCVSYLATSSYCFEFAILKNSFSEGNKV